MKNGGAAEHVRSKETTFYGGERAVYMLLADHPHFVEQVATIRKRYGVPRGGFTDGEKAFHWEHDGRHRAPKVRKDAEGLIADFSIKITFQSEARFFAYDYILSPRIVANLLPLPADMSKKDAEKTVASVGRHKIGARLIETTTDIETSKHQFKANAFYLEITDHTTTRDVEALLKKTLKRRKDTRPFTMPKPQEKARMAWLMKTKGATNQQTADAIFRTYGTRLTPQQIPLYESRYAKALSILRPMKR